MDSDTENFYWKLAYYICKLGVVNRLNLFGKNLGSCLFEVARFLLVDLSKEMADISEDFPFPFRVDAYELLNCLKCSKNQIFTCYSNKFWPSQFETSYEGRLFLPELHSQEKFAEMCCDCEPEHTGDKKSYVQVVGNTFFYFFKASLRNRGIMIDFLTQENLKNGFVLPKHGRFYAKSIIFIGNKEQGRRFAVVHRKGNDWMCKDSKFDKKIEIMEWIENTDKLPFLIFFEAKEN